MECEHRGTFISDLWQEISEIRWNKCILNKTSSFRYIIPLEASMSCNAHHMRNHVAHKNGHTSHIKVVLCMITVYQWVIPVGCCAAHTTKKDIFSGPASGRTSCVEVQCLPGETSAGSNLSNYIAQEPWCGSTDTQTTPKKTKLFAHFLPSLSNIVISALDVP